MNSLKLNYQNYQIDNQTILDKVMDLKLSELFFVLMLVVNLAIPNVMQNKSVAILGFYVTFFFCGFWSKHNTAKYFYWGICFVSYAALSLFWASSRSTSLEQLNNVIWAISLNVMIARFIVVKNIPFDRICKIMIGCFLILLVNTLLVGELSLSDSRLVIGINENDYGKIASNLGLFILLYSVLTKKRALLLLMIPQIALVFLSGSRKALISTAFYILLVILYKNPKQILKNLFVGGIIMAFLLMLLIRVDFFYQVIGHRVVGIVDIFSEQGTADGSLISRFNMISLAWEMFKESPITGHGLNNFKYMAYYNTYSHNNYLELLTGLGLVGLVLYYIPFMRILFSSFKFRRKYPFEMLLTIGVLTMLFILDWSNVSSINFADHIFIGLAVGFYYQSLNNRFRPSTKEKLYQSSHSKNEV